MRSIDVVETMLWSSGHTSTDETLLLCSFQRVWSLHVVSKEATKPRLSDARILPSSVFSQPARPVNLDGKATISSHSQILGYTRGLVSTFAKKINTFLELPVITAVARLRYRAKALGTKAVDGYSSFRIMRCNVSVVPYCVQTISFL